MTDATILERRADGAADREAAQAAFSHLAPGDVLLSYQQRCVARLFAGVSLLAIDKSRRIGLTWGLASYAAMKSALQASAGGMDTWYMGYDQEMAREFIETCAMWAKVYGMAAEEVDEELVPTGKGEKPVQAFRLRFSSGFKIVALPSVARALRGKQGLVIIDEAAFHDDLAEVIKAALALLMWGGQVVIVSTHDGTENPFNLLLDDIDAKKRKGERITITFQEAIDAGLYDRIKMMAEIKGRPVLEREAWIKDILDTYGEDADEELHCIPKAGSGSFLDLAMLAACEHPDAGRPELYSGGLFFMGRDVARRRDNAVIYGGELVGDVLWLRNRWVRQGVSFQTQDDAAAEMIRDRHMVKYLIDQTGMGEAVVEAEQRRYGVNRCEGVLLTGPNRLDLAFALKDRIDRCALRIPPKPEIRVDFRAIKKKGGVAGSVTLVNEGEVHADEFWAGGLMCAGAAMSHQPYAYHPVQRRDHHDMSPLAQRRYENEHGSGMGSGFRGYRP